MGCIPSRSRATVGIEYFMYHHFLEVGKNDRHEVRHCDVIYCELSIIFVLL